MKTDRSDWLVVKIASTLLDGALQSLGMLAKELQLAFGTLLEVNSLLLKMPNLQALKQCQQFGIGEAPDLSSSSTQNATSNTAYICSSHSRPIYWRGTT